jgi:carbon monoxide dehydrogenase subunit G
MDNWAVLLPGYQRHEKLDEVHSTWTVRGEVGVLARSVDLEVTIDEWVEEEKVAFSLNGLTEIVTGNGVFRMRGPGSVIAAPALEGGKRASSARPKLSWFRRFFGLFKRSEPVAATPAAAPRVIADGESGFDFDLALTAGGMTGPLVNTMLDSLIVKLCEEFATNVAAAIEAGVAQAPVPAPDKPSSPDGPKGDVPG